MFDDLKPQKTQSGVQPLKGPGAKVPPNSGAEPEDILRNVDKGGSQPPSGVVLNQGKEKPPQFEAKQGHGVPSAHSAGSGSSAGPPPDLPVTPPSQKVPENTATPPPPPPRQEPPSATGGPPPHSASSGPLEVEAEDIFSDVDRSAPKVRGPQSPQIPTAPKTPGVKPPQAQAPFDKKGFSPKRSSGRMKKLMLVGLIIVLAAGVGIGGWALYARLSAQPALEIDDIERQPTQDTFDTIPDTSPPEPVEVDSDFDGIPDSEETLYGTSPTKVDTDSDGLTDRDEIRTFKTDPVNPDTDGDSYLDGEEILNGYDPKGPGKLQEF